MLLGPQTFPLMRETGARRSPLVPVPASGPSPVLLRSRDAETTGPRRELEEEFDITLYAMMSPCCGFAYWPEGQAGGVDDPARDFGKAVADMSARLWRRIAPALAFVGRSVVFLTIVALMGVFGLKLLVML
jgi:hypothetical protein